VCQPLEQALLLVNAFLQYALHILLGAAGAHKLRLL
jgi:hypothetical protein